MRRLRVSGRGQVAVEDVPLPQPKAGEVLVKTVFSAVCGSELKAYEGDGFPEGNVGHEACGTVVALGDGVGIALALGDRVGLSAIVGCGACEECDAGRYTWCAHFTFHPQMHAEYIAIPAHGCHRLPEDVPFDVGVLISGDGFGVPYHTSRRFPEPTGGQSVAIFGLGPIGLGSVIMHRWLGRTVIAVDRAPERLALAESLGADHCLSATVSGDEITRRIRTITNGRGCDSAIEAAGVPATVHAGLAAVRRGGTVFLNGEQPALPISPSDDLIRRDIALVGSWFYHFHEFNGMLRDFRAGLPVARLVSHRLPLEQAGEAYRLMRAGRSGKILLTYD
jgi:propanol-preferring alcohol dehydrogenase